MDNYRSVFNGNKIYNYPFNKNIAKFTILWWININILNESDFNILLKLLKDKVTCVIITFISRDGHVVKELNYSFVNFTYTKYKDLCLGKWDYNIRFDRDDTALSFSEEFFCLIWWTEKFINNFIVEIWEESINDWLKKFNEEWSFGTKDSWSYSLTLRENFVKNI